MLDTTFQQVRDSQKLRPQNPTTAGRGGERYWTVRSGETLAWVAYQVYNDSSKWRHIAEKNKLTQLRELVPGTILEIPNA
jgi:nucleoid-associated protein YgaU